LLDATALTGVLWIIFFSYWLIAARNTKKTVYRQKLQGRVFIAIRLAVCFALVYLPALSAGWLGVSYIPRTMPSEFIGNIVCISGFFFAIWSRRALGTNWSGEITLKENHQLIQTGPYRLVRHPIYTGLILAWLGTAITLGEVRGLVALVIAFLGLWSKLKEEETLLLRQFPEEYPEYQEQVKALIPFVL